MGRLALLSATLIWGSSFVILKNTLDSVPTLWILALRFCGAAAFMLLICWKKLKLIDKSYIKGGAIMGLILSCSYIVQTYGLVYTTPGKNAFLTATYCVMVPFMAWWFRKKRPDRYNISAAFICIAGMGFVTLGKDLSVNIGDLLTICCGVGYALHIITTDKYVEGHDPMLVTTLQFVFGSIITLSAALISGPFPQHVPASAWWSIAYMSIMCSAVALLLQTVGQKYTPPAAASVIMTLESVFGTVISVIFYHESLTAEIIIGFALIFVSIIISETKLGFLKKQQKCAEKS